MGLLDITSTDTADTPKAFEQATSLEAHTAVLANVMKSNKPKPAIRPNESKEALYIAMDPTLALLFKEWKSAQSQYRALMAQFGEDDAMLDVAIDRLDAARLSFETRLLELKADKQMFVKVENLFDEELAAEKRVGDAREAEKARLQMLKEIQDEWFAFAARNNADAHQNKDSNIIFWAFLILVAFGRGFGFNTSLTYTYNRALAA